MNVSVRALKYWALTGFFCVLGLGLKSGWLENRQELTKYTIL